MLINFLDATAATDFHADICLVGSGAAGLTLAAHLAGLRVLIVEAGGRSPSSDGGNWLAGEAADWAFTGFESGRNRSYGGATKRWYGQCIRLDPIDFEPRDWVPHSGWPITAQDLDPYYDQAESFVGLGNTLYDSRIWPRSGIPDPAFDGDVQAKFTAYMPQPDFTKLLGRDFVKQSSVDILVNAAATCIELDSNGRHVTGLAIRAQSGKQGQVRARAFVLCGGGIDNPRLMLASNTVMSGGVGNARDLVGRFFQDHPSGTTGTLATTKAATVQNQFRKLRQRGVTFWPKLALSEAAQRRERTLNANALILYTYAEDSPLTRAKAVLQTVQARKPAALAREGGRLLRHAPELAARMAHTVATGKAPIFKPSRVMLKTHVEQRPDPLNRITLSNERDAFGLPLPRLAWRVHAEELRTMRCITEAVGRAFDGLGWGEMTVSPWLDQGADAARPELEDTYHHHGTTRMAATADEGVTDADCLVFGTENLYVAGSSLFPTSGYANPTLTIIALAIRLGDTLRTRMRQSGAEGVG